MVLKVCEVVDCMVVAPSIFYTPSTFHLANPKDLQKQLKFHHPILAGKSLHNGK